LKEKRERNVNYPDDDEELDDNNVNEVDERESNSESGEGEEKVVLNPEFMVLTDWPEDITHLYIDGNNLLYIAKNIRNMTIRRKGKKKHKKYSLDPLNFFLLSLKTSNQSLLFLIILAQYMKKLLV